MQKNKTHDLTLPYTNHIIQALQIIGLQYKHEIKTYRVGGCVRDQLLDLKAKDIDYVVVGATVNDMKQVGLKQVGSNFPCFIDKKTNEEYALARTEIKSGTGYQGFNCNFEPNVTLKDDLHRRDLTINAIAQDCDGNLVDPYNGLKDIENKILRHTSEAFIEDPLRVLRIARFAARFSHLGFTIADETKALMQEISNSGELEHLTPERVWLETKKALSERHPSVYFETLRESKALSIIFPEINDLFGIPQTEKHHPEIDTGIHTMMSLEQAALLTNNIAIRFAALTHDLGKGITPHDMLPSHIGHEKSGVQIVISLCNRLKIPNKYRHLAVKVTQYHLHCHTAFQLRPKTIMALINNLDGLRNPETFENYIIVCEADAKGRKGFENNSYPQADYLRECLQCCQSINIKALVDQGLKGKNIGEAIQEKQVNAISNIKEKWNF